MHALHLICTILSVLLNCVPFATAYFLPLDIIQLVGLFLLAVETLYYLVYLCKGLWRWHFYKPTWPVKRIWLPFLNLWLHTAYWLGIALHSGSSMAAVVGSSISLFDVLPAALLTYWHYRQINV